MSKSASEAEKALRNRVQAQFKKRGTLYWAVSDALIKGLPDIQGIIKGRPFHIEFKAADGRLAPLQEYWLKLIALHGGGAFEVRAETDKGVGPWYAKYRRMSGAGQWAETYTVITSPDWLDKEMLGNI
jgi:hypothetical protein